MKKKGSIKAFSRGFLQNSLYQIAYALSLFLAFCTLASCCGRRCWGPTRCDTVCTEPGIPVVVWQRPTCCPPDGVILTTSTQGTSTSSATSAASTDLPTSTTGDSSVSATADPLSNLLTPTTDATVNAIFVTGQGRRYPNSYNAILNNIGFQFGNLVQNIPLRSTDTNELSIPLDRYGSYAYTLRGQFPASLSSISLTGVSFDIVDMQEIAPTGARRLGLQNQRILSSLLFPVRATLLPGRVTTLKINLNDSTLRYNPNTHSAEFRRDIFELENFDPASKSIRGFLSDLVSFDVSSLAAHARPRLGNGVLADRVLLSGDFIAISSGVGRPQNMYVVTPFKYTVGTLFQGTTATYVLHESDPQQFLQTGYLSTLSGPWQEYSKVLQNPTSNLLIAFPSSTSATTQQAVLLSLNSSKRIQTMWVGTLSYASNRNTGNFRMCPVAQLGTPNPSFALSGTVGSFLKQNGEVVRGAYTLNQRPGNVPASGDFIVYRF